MPGRAGSESGLMTEKAARPKAPHSLILHSLRSRKDKITRFFPRFTGARGIFDPLTHPQPDTTTPFRSTINH